MSDTTIKKIDSSYSPHGDQRQKYLVEGKSISMRLWEKESPTTQKEETQRDYETVGYVLEGRAELYCEGQMVLLTPGDSWVVPKGSRHRYHILESFTAIEATSPPAEVHGRDDKLESKKDTNQEKKQTTECASLDDAQANEGTAESEEKKALEVASKIPRDSDNITSNSAEKEPVPAEHIDAEPKK